MHIKSIVIALFLVLTLSVNAATLIVGNKREHTVSFIDLESGKENARVNSGRAPHEVAVSPDGRLAVVVSYRDAGYIGNSLHVFDVVEGKKLGMIGLGKHRAPHGLKWIPNTRTVIATTEDSKDLVIVDVDTRKLINAIATEQSGSHMLTLSPDAKRAYVANIQSGSFSVIDLVNKTKLRDVKAGRGTEAIAVTPDGKEIWVGNNNSRSVMVFNASSFEKLSEIKTKGIPIRVEISPDGTIAAVSEPDKNQVSIYSVNTRQKITEVDVATVGGKVPVTLLFSQDGNTLWAATTQAARVIEINTQDWTINRSIAAGKGSDGLGVSKLSSKQNLPN